MAGGLTDVVVEAQPDAGAGGPVRAVGVGGGMGQLEGEGVGGGLTVGRVLGQGAQDHIRDRGGRPRRRRGDEVEVLLPQRAHRQLRVERRHAGQ